MADKITTKRACEGKTTCMGRPCRGAGQRRPTCLLPPSSCCCSSSAFTVYLKLLQIETVDYLSGADTMKRCPLGHSYSNPMKTLDFNRTHNSPSPPTLTVILSSTGSSGPRRLARLAWFSTIEGHFASSCWRLALVRGTWFGDCNQLCIKYFAHTSQGRRNLAEDMKPGCCPSPAEWL